MQHPYIKTMRMSPLTEVKLHNEPYIAGTNKTYMQLFFISLSILIQSYTQDLSPVQVTDNISMLIPSDFRPMTDDEIASKYFTTKRPLVLYTNRDLTIDLGVNQSVTQWVEKDIEIMADFQKSNVFNLYDDVKIISEGTKEINGRKAVYMEFISTVNPDKDSFRNEGSIQKYTYIQYIIVGKHALVFNFTSPSQLQEEWQGAAHQIMDDVRIKGKIK
ncbi:hypothetical protein SAMN04488028_1011090 [Reichenbachiella agariperforans]|uniref:Uncharacterized protein n=1 Tax=Reichenbachiella agariperforans TaxID=156994 RepID=A0A1M6LTG4_REIAG|nr:hypothetical protein [Reichenbachiella agariperforans]SHJ74503.1 hypothetical protein SAMN04488028_1011090 [Reichenbachiella agariperforans]